MKLAGSTDIGMVRGENQDNYRGELLAGGTVWAAVCDGMGGANGGRIASSIACDVIESSLSSRCARMAAGTEKQLLVQTMEKANDAVYQKSRNNADLAGMGTTAVVVIVSGDLAHICHAGDSRCYLYRSGNLTQLTRDHSYVQELVDKGTITAAEAEMHPRKNVITRALGVEPGLVPEYTCANVLAGDILLLCTDGLSNAVQKRRMEYILTNNSVYRAADALIQAANASGGPDNITAVLIGVDSEV